MFNRKTEASKLTDEVVTARIEGERSFFGNMVEIKRRFLGIFCKRIKAFSGEAKFKSTKRNDDVEFLFKDLIFFDEAFNKLTVVDD